jgi:hypothetical protein
MKHPQDQAQQQGGQCRTSALPPQTAPLLSDKVKVSAVHGKQRAAHKWRKSLPVAAIQHGENVVLRCRPYSQCVCPQPKFWTGPSCKRLLASGSEQLKNS